MSVLFSEERIRWPRHSSSLLVSAYQISPECDLPSSARENDPPHRKSTNLLEEGKNESSIGIGVWI